MSEPNKQTLMPVSPDYITTKEASEILGVHVVRVQQLESSGVLKAEKNSWGWRLFLRSDVEALREKRKALKEAQAELRRPV
jgi:DNA-binding transcriptional MerR regulator